MNMTKDVIMARWLNGRAPAECNVSEALKFADECWQVGPRLSAKKSLHHQLVVSLLRWSFVR